MYKTLQNLTYVKKKSITVVHNHTCVKESHEFMHVHKSLQECTHAQEITRVHTGVQVTFGISEASPDDYFIYTVLSL